MSRTAVDILWEIPMEKRSRPIGNIHSPAGYMTLLSHLLYLHHHHHHHHLLSQDLALLPLNQWCTPPLRLQVSDCCTFLVMCSVHSTVFFCTESVECSPGIIYRYFFSPLFTITVAPMINVMTKNFIFHTR